MRYVHSNDHVNSLISILMIVIGLILLIWPGHVMTSALKILGIALLVGGVICAATWYRGRMTDIGPARLAEGIVMAVAGLVVLTMPKLVISIVPIALGLGIMANGALNLAQAFDQRREGYSRWGFSLALAAVTLLLGLVMVFNPFSTMETLVAAIGVIMLYNGASNLWIESRYRKLF